MTNAKKALLLLAGFVCIIGAVLAAFGILRVTRFSTVSGPIVAIDEGVNAEVVVIRSGDKQYIKEIGPTDKNEYKIGDIATVMHVHGASSWVLMFYIVVLSLGSIAGLWSFICYLAAKNKERKKKDYA